MEPSKLKSAYRNFFFKTEEGQHFMTALGALIEQHHERAEDEPDSARDEAQKALGVREVMKHIQVVTTDIKKGRG